MREIEEGGKGRGWKGSRERCSDRMAERGLALWTPYLPFSWGGEGGSGVSSINHLCHATAVAAPIRFLYLPIIQSHMAFYFLVFMFLVGKMTSKSCTF